MKVRGVEYPKWWWVPFMGMGVLLVAGVATIAVMWSGGLVSDAEKSRMVIEKSNPTMHELDEAIRLNPDFEDAYIKRAKARLLAGDMAGASADVDVALHASPGDQSIQQLRAEIRRVGATSQATSKP